MKNVDGSELVEVQNIIDNAFHVECCVKHKKIKILRDEIEIDCEHSLTHAEISVKTKNQQGVLAYIMDIFEQLNINIITAKIHSTKHKVRDSFLMEKQNDICNNVDKIYELLTIR